MENGVFLKMVLKKTDFRSSWKAIKDKRVFNVILLNSTNLPVGAGLYLLANSFCIYLV